MKKAKRILSVVLCLVMLLCAVPVMEAGAITFAQLNDNSVFLKQAGSSTCTLCAATMMLRRYSMLRGDSGWNTITESAVRPTAWIEGTGLRWSFTYSNSSVGGISVGHYTLPGGSANEAKIQEELAKCPEGIVIYNTSVPHAVLLTDYTDGVYYCADPLGSYPSGRIPLTSAYKVRITNVTAYWKVTSPAVSGPTEEMDFSPIVGDDKNAVVVGENITFWYAGLTECSKAEFCIVVDDTITQIIDSTSSRYYTTYFTGAGTYQVFARGYYNGKWYNSGRITVKVLNPVIQDDKNTVCIGEPITFTYSGLRECSEVQFEFSKNGTVYYSPDSTSSTTFTTCFVNPGTYYVNAAGYLDGNWCRSGKIKVEAVNHSYGAWTKLNDTQHQRVCSRDSSHVEKANHTWNSGTITQAATCSATGVKTYTCSVCNGTKTETVAINSSNHAHTTDVAETASTCTVKGYSAGVYCNDCKKYISGHQEQPLAAHKTETRNARTATCTAEGYTGDQYCTVCKQTISTGTTIGKKAHTLTTINQKAANCTEKGYTGDQYCTTCKQTITKGSATAALGHTAPDSNGNCTRCGKHIKDVSPTQPTQPSQPQTNPNACKWCGKVHNGNFFDRIIGFFHSILALFKR